MKKILITGASGFVGSHAARFFLDQGFSVTGIGTSKTHPLSNAFKQFEWISADTSLEGEWQKNVKTADILINLAGRSIFKYWTGNYKKAIYDSRILTTRNLVNAIEKGSHQVLVSTSAVGIYGDRKNDDLTEDDLPGSSFLARVCVDWEKEALQAIKKDVRVSIMRLGVVLGDKGALSIMVPAFRLFAGGPLGSGNHYFPWIHINDVIQAASFIIGNDTAYGIFNFTGPFAIRQKEFAKALGKSLHRPAFIPVPGFMVRLVMGELGSALLESQKVYPKHLLDLGYSFSHETADAALMDVFKK